jgi:phosphate starvation-inducible protein PhoH and related proteins
MPRPSRKSSSRNPSEGVPRSPKLTPNWLEPSEIRYKPFKPRNYKQESVMRTLDESTLTFLVGSAGTGKTFLAVAHAIQRLKTGQISKIVAARPAVEAGDSVGFLTGDLTQKMNPYLRPVLDSISFFVGGDGPMKSLMESGVLEVTSLTYLRGRTFNDCDLIGDEMQNATSAQLKTFLTRGGENCKMYVTMDPKQCDLPDRGASCSHDLQRFVDRPDIAIVDFGIQDVVRSQIVKTVLKCYGE